MKTLLLYTGSFEPGELANERLKRWSETQPDINVERRSVHGDPAAVVRLGITSVPALVMDDEIIVQGSPDFWLTDDFLQSLRTRVGTDCLANTEEEIKRCSVNGPPSPSQSTRLQ